MAAERVQDGPFADADDDDMPPLVDNPYPPMNFVFAANMTPITYGMDPAGFEAAPEAVFAPTYTIPPEESYAAPDTRTSHTKKKDAGHIPRPPNAFILFRSSFIRAQHIPEKIEGNHSALSKIIGKYWKALPSQEREKWEAKAIVALAEHRQKYPDWRFRPGANLLSKVKDGPRRRNNRKGRGEVEKEVKIRSKRCDKIADLLVAGKTGVDLEVAVEQYDCEAGTGPKANDEDGCGVLVMKIENPAGFAQTQTQTGTARGKRGAARMKGSANSPRAADTKPVIRPYAPRPAVHGPAKDTRFKTPLTAMFKRSSSAPVAADRGPSASPPSPSPQIFARRDSLSVLPLTGLSEAVLASPPGVRGGADARVGHAVSSTPHPSAMRGGNVDGLTLPHSPSSPFVGVQEFDPAPTQPQWLEAYIQDEANRYTPTLPAFVPDLDSPAPSPPAFPLEFSPECEHSAMAITDNSTSVSQTLPVYAQSPYSPPDEWAGEIVYAAKCMSGVYPPVASPFVVTPLSPAEYDYDSIMKDALEAASYTQLDDYGMEYASVHASCYWGNGPAATGTYHHASGIQHTAWS